MPEVNFIKHQQLPINCIFILHCYILFVRVFICARCRTLYAILGVPDGGYNYRWNLVI